jgi:hypothetical protein
VGVGRGREGMGGQNGRRSVGLGGVESPGEALDTAIGKL